MGENRSLITFANIISFLVALSLIHLIHTAFWKWIYGKIGKAYKLDKLESNLSMLVWMIGASVGSLSWLEVETEGGVLLNSFGLVVVTWLGGMLGLSLFEIIRLIRNARR